MEKESKEVELKKIEIELGLLKDILKALLFVLVADIGGTITIILNFNKYNPDLATGIVWLGIFTISGLLYALIIILFEIINLRAKLED